MTGIVTTNLITIVDIVFDNICQYLVVPHIVVLIRLR